MSYLVKEVDSKDVFFFKKVLRKKNKSRVIYSVDDKSSSIYKDMEKSISKRFICEMSKKVKEFPLENMWKSKLVYSFTRNMDKKYISILNILNDLIEKNPRETKITICEFIYKRRKNGTD